MTKQKDFSSSINAFTHNVNAIINLKKIDNQEFFNDVNSLKDKSLGIKAFKKKYIELFDGTFGKGYTSKTSFLGSYRRNMNPKYYNQSKSKDVVEFNQELRFNTTEKPKIDKKVKAKFKSTKSISGTKLTASSKTQYKEKLGYIGFAKTEIGKLKQTWNLKEVYKHNLVAYQEIQFRVNYAVVDIDGNIITPDIWITIRSNISPNDSLLWLYDYAFDKFLEFVMLLEQSKLFIKLNKVCTYAFREAN